MPITKVKRASATPRKTADQIEQRRGGIKAFIAKVKAKKQARKIMRSYNEAQRIHAGAKPAKTFDQFLENF